MGKRGPKPRPIEERLILKRSIVGDCWIWTGHKNTMGYGVLSTGHIGQKYVHRVAYELWVSPIGNLNVCHSCDTPLCFNPKHLWLGTQRDNLQDALKKGRCRNKVFYGKDHPIHKHPEVWQNRKRVGGRFV